MRNNGCDSEETDRHEDDSRSEPGSEDEILSTGISQDCDSALEQARSGAVHLVMTQCPDVDRAKMAVDACRADYDPAKYGPVALPNVQNDGERCLLSFQICGLFCFLAQRPCHSPSGE
jgi:hypothetical protein